MILKATKNKSNQSKKDVWYGDVQIGFCELVIKENKDLDWDAIRKDKSIVVDVKDRWIFQYKAYSTIGSMSLGVFENEELACEKVLEHHRSEHERAMEPVDH